MSATPNPLLQSEEPIAVRAFISYCHESPEHKASVLDLADRLCRDGVDCALDQYVLAPEQGWVNWMIEHISKSDYIIIICTETYNRRSRGLEPNGAGKGVKFETLLSYQELYDDGSHSCKLVPIVFHSEDLKHVPTPLRSFQTYSLDIEDGYENLYRRLTNQPRIVKPPSTGIKRLPTGENLLSNDVSEKKTGNTVAGILRPNDQDRTPATQTVAIELHIADDFTNYSSEEQEALLPVLRELLKIKDEIRIRGVRLGSVIVTIELASDKVQELSTLFVKGELKKYNIFDVRELRRGEGRASQVFLSRGRREERAPARALPTGSGKVLTRMATEALFVEHLDWIDKIAAVVCRTHGVWGDEAEDVVAWIKMKLAADDYAVFRQFRGECMLQTYLTSVVVRQFHEYSRRRWGRWRPSARAERLGGPAKELEALVYRDGYTLQQAGETLRSAGRTTLSDIELARLLDRLPTRSPVRPAEVGSNSTLHAAEKPSRADEVVAAAEAEARRGEVMEALERAIAQLEPEEAMIVRMHFVEGYTLLDMGSILGIEQKPLYRRIERLRVRLRGYLESAGVGRRDVHELLWEQ